MSWFTEYAAFFNIAQIVQLWVTDKTRQRSDLIQNVVYDQVRRDIFIGPAVLLHSSIYACKTFHFSWMKTVSNSHTGEWRIYII